MKMYVNKAGSDGAGVRKKKKKKSAGRALFGVLPSAGPPWELQEPGATVWRGGKWHTHTQTLSHSLQQRLKMYV